MIQFTLEPFIGPLPLQFGMSSDEVGRIIGAAKRRVRGHTGMSIEIREAVNLSFSNDGLSEAVVLPNACCYFDGANLMQCDDVIGFLRKYDDAPFRFAGFVLFLKLGIRLSGFVEGDDEEKAIAVVRQGHWDGYGKDLIPY